MHFCTLRVCNKCLAVSLALSFAVALQYVDHPILFDYHFDSSRNAVADTYNVEDHDRGSERCKFSRGRFSNSPSVTSHDSDFASEIKIHLAKPGAMRGVV